MSDQRLLRVVAVITHCNLPTRAWRAPEGLDQIGWRGYLNPKSGSPATTLGSPTTFFATILYCFSGELARIQVVQRDYLNPTLGSLTGLFLEFRSPWRWDYAICWALMWRGTIANCTGWPLIMQWLLLNYVPPHRLHRRWSISGLVSRLVMVPSPLALLQLRPCTCRYPLIFTPCYTKIKGLHKAEINICPLFVNIRNGNTQKWEIRGNCHTEKIAILQ